MYPNTFYFDIYNPNVIYALFCMSMKNLKKSPAIQYSLFEICDNNQLLVKSRVNDVWLPFHMKERSVLSRQKIAKMIDEFFKENNLSFKDADYYNNHQNEFFNFKFTSGDCFGRSYLIKFNESFTRILEANSNNLDFNVPIYQLMIAYDYFRKSNLNLVIKRFGEESVRNTLRKPLNPMEIECNKNLIEEERKLVNEIKEKIELNFKIRKQKIREIDDKFNEENKKLDDELQLRIKDLRKTFAQMNAI